MGFKPIAWTFFRSFKHLKKQFKTPCVKLYILPTGIQKVLIFLGALTFWRCYNQTQMTHVPLQPWKKQKLLDYKIMGYVDFDSSCTFKIENSRQCYAEEIRIQDCISPIHFPGKFWLNFENFFLKKKKWDILQNINVSEIE